MLIHVPADLQFLHKVHIVLLRAMSAMVRVDLKSPNCDASVLRSFISIFDSELLALTPSSPSELGQSYQCQGRSMLIGQIHFN